jgi:hypothetical protein
VSIDRTEPDYQPQGVPGVTPDRGEPMLADELATPGPLKPPGRFGLPEPVEGAVPTDPQLAVFFEAFRLYEQRNKKHRSVWKESGWMGMMVDMRKKMDRIWSQFSQYRSDEDVSQEDLDSALDLLNFTVFFIRQVRDDERNGSWEWPG